MSFLARPEVRILPEGADLSLTEAQKAEIDRRLEELDFLAGC